MLRVPIHNIQPKMILARPVPLPSDPQRFLLQRDHEIPMDLVPRLKQLGIVEVWVRCRDLEFLEDVIDEGLGEGQREIYSHVRRNFEKMMQGASGQLDLHQFQESIGGLFGFLRGSNCGNLLLQKLDAFDNYLMSHSTNVCYLALLLGMKLERYLIDQRKAKTPRDAKDVQLLGLGCLLHDVGKMKISSAILNKPGRLTEDEMELMKLHPVFGYEMVKGRIPASASEVVLNHHQRYNGEGYPPRRDPRTGDAIPPLAGQRIPIFSRIATLADVYDAATTTRCYSGAKLPVRVLDEMHRMVGTFFDPVVAEAFFQTVPAFPIGQVVTLSDGHQAVVVDFNPHRPVRPKVQCLRDPGGARIADPSLYELDLGLYDDLQIAYVDGVDVRPYQASQCNREAAVAEIA